MSDRLTGERMLMRIFIGESDRAQQGPYRGKPLWEALMLDFRERGFAGTTVIRGMSGFGANAKIRTTLVELMSFDLPIVIEVVETEENIRAALPDLDQMVGAGLVTLERIEVIIYRSEQKGV
jgi:PII-like signaling protein